MVIAHSVEVEKTALKSGGVMLTVTFRNNEDGSVICSKKQKCFGSDEAIDRMVPAIAEGLKEDNLELFEREPTEIERLAEMEGMKYGNESSEG